MPRKLHEIVYKVHAKREQGKPGEDEGGGRNFGATESTAAKGMVFRERRQITTNVGSEHKTLEKRDSYVENLGYGFGFN
jgi:hypothetical protein